MAAEELRQVLKDVALAVQHTTWFMLDEALPHVTCSLNQFVYSHYSLIGWNKLVLWPPLSFISLLLPSACVFIWKVWCSMNCGVRKKRLQRVSHNTGIRKWNHQLGDLVLAMWPACHINHYAIKVLTSQLPSWPSFLAYLLQNETAAYKVNSMFFQSPDFKLFGG
jgi:hypothetical protein